MDALCKCMFIIIETILNIEHDEHVSKVIHVFQRILFMSIRHMKKEIPGSYYFSFFALEQFTYTNLFTFLHARAALLLNMQNVNVTFIIRFVCLSVPTYCILMQLNSQ